MTYEIVLSDCARYVIFRPNKIGRVLEEFMRRRTAIIDFSDEHGVDNILMDYRGTSLSVEPGFFGAALAEPGIKAKRKRRVAVLLSIGDPSHSIFVAASLADMLAATGHDACRFLDHAEAVSWLVNSASAPATSG